jgi:hypothetical protein
VWARKLEAVDRQQSSPVGLVYVFSERSDLSRGSHFYTTSAALFEI